MHTTVFTGGATAKFVRESMGNGGVKKTILAELESAISSEACVIAGNWRVNHYATGPSSFLPRLDSHVRLVN